MRIKPLASCKVQMKCHFAISSGSSLLCWNRLILKRNTLFDLIILGDMSLVLHLQMEFYCGESVKLSLTALKMTIFLSKVKVLNTIIPY